MPAQEFKRFHGDTTPRITEQREFTNPAVRFVKIRGRVVPIFNKKRIGEMTTSGSRKVLGAGAALATVGVVARVLSKKLPKLPKLPNFLTNEKLTNVLNKIVGKRKSVPVPTVDSFKKKILKGSLTVISSPLRKPIVIGTGLMSLGLLGALLGTELQARSGMGFDILPEKK